MNALDKLLKSSILTDETKVVLKEAWETAQSVNRAEVEAEYAAKLNEAKAELSTQSIQLVEEAIAEELTAIADELADARSLEIQYAAKLNEFKESYAEKTTETINTLVSESVTRELDEMKEDIQFAKKHQFGVSMFESFSETYGKLFGEPDTNIHQELEEARNELDSLRREKIIGELVESVSGEKRGIVMTILESVATDKLVAKFETLRPVILAESAPAATAPVDGSTQKPTEGTVVIESANGDDGEAEPINEGIDPRIAARLQKTLNFIK